MPSRLESKHPRSLTLAGLIVVLALVSGWLLLPESRPGEVLARASYDWSQSFLPPVPLSNSPVVLVYLDLDSHLREKQNPAEPWSRALHARLVRRLTEAGARAIGFDIIFAGPSADLAADRELAEAIHANGRVVLAAEINRSSRGTAQVEGIKSLQLSMPAKTFLDAAAAWGVANARVDDDFIVRRHFHGFPEQHQPSLTLATAQLIGLPLALADTDLLPAKWLRYYGRALALPHVSYSSALHRDEVKDEFFRDKIVLVGARPMAGTFGERKDEFRNPLSAWGDQELFMPAVEVHATQLLNLMHGDSLRRLPPLAELLMLALTAGLFGWLLYRFRPFPAAGMALAGEVVVFAVVAFALPAQRVWFPWLIVSAVQIPIALAASVLYQSLEWYRQKRRLEAQRRADEVKIREQAALIEKAQDAILVQDLQGQINYANPSAEKLFGWSASELQQEGAARRLFAPSHKQFAEAIQATHATGEWQGELRPSTRAGRTLIVESRGTLIKDECGRAISVLLINTDVTERRQLEAESLRAQRLESIGALAGGMAHDLNNALSPILMGLQLLQKERQDEETRRMLAVMESNTHRGADMVKQVLLFARGRDGEKEPLALGSLVHEMERIVRQTFPKAINVAALVPADLWPVLGNATQLHQVLLNLCVNARDAMPRGGELTLAADNVELTPAEATGIPQGAPGRYVMLLVSDTGNGIAPEVMPRIFEPFFTTKPVGEGTGLGLSTSARIVSQHGGFMNVKSEPGRGATFELYLPCATIAPTPETQRASFAEAPRGGGEMILLVDDEQALREMISRTLTDQGYQVTTATHGAEALLHLNHSGDSVQLVLLDQEMPVMDGRATLTALRTRWPKLPVILMSGKIGPEALPHTTTLGKPFQLHQLLQAVAAQCHVGK